jgi:membrane protease YdiL (CAAX protease family)
MSKDLSSNKPLNGVNTLGVLATLFVGAFAFFSSQYIGVIIILIVLLALGSERQEVVDLLSENSLAQLVTLTVVATITIFIIYKFLKWRKISPKKLLLLENKPTRGMVLDVVLTYGLYFLVLIILTVFLDIFTPVNIEQSQELGIADPESLGSKLIIFAMLVIIPPIYEELLFRGFLFNMLKKHGGQILSIILTSLLFGAAHLEYDNLNWIAAIDTLIFSGFLIYISQKHQSLYSAMMLHALKNAVAFYVLFAR